MPKLEPQIEFSVGTSSHELAKHLDFAVRRSCVLIPRTPLRTFHQLLFLPRRSALPNPCSRRANLTFCTCLLAQGWQSTPMVSILNTSGAAAGCYSCARGPISVGWCWPAPSRWVVVARCRIGRDEFFTSDNDQGVFEHLRLVDVLLVCTSTGLLIYRVRGAARCVCLCFLSAAEMVGGGVG